jgi:hypothetical protein
MIREAMADADAADSRGHLDAAACAARCSLYVVGPRAFLWSRARTAACADVVRVYPSDP